MINTYVKRVELNGIHRRYDLDVSFNKSLNVLHGKNGTGKSTLIHIIANVANCDFIRFAFLEFDSIKVTYSNDSFVEIIQTDEKSEKKIKVLLSNGEEVSFYKSDAVSIDSNPDENSRIYNNRSVSLDYKFQRDISEFIRKNSFLKIETSYFPAFRTMFEALSSVKKYSNTIHGSRFPQDKEFSDREATSFSRQLFGRFIPKINYPSPLDIERSLRNEISDCRIRIANYESSIFSDSFVKVFSSLLGNNSVVESTENLLDEISKLTLGSDEMKMDSGEEKSDAYRKLQSLISHNPRVEALEGSTAGALSVYRDALKERKKFQIQAFQEIDRYFEVVNFFLDNKELSYSINKNRKMSKVGLKFPDSSWSSIGVMSSGERQLLTMLYAVNKMSGNSSVLIDEPELSLHIDWQEDLLGKMMDQLGDRQIIVCTHSPSIASDFEEYMKEIKPIFKDSNFSEFDKNELDEEFI